MSKRVPGSVQWVLWDLEAEALDPDAHADAILARVLEHGGIAEVRWAVGFYGLDRIHSFFQNNPHPLVSDRTRAFWRAFFRAEEEQWTERPDWRRSSATPWSG